MNDIEELKPSSKGGSESSNFCALFFGLGFFEHASLLADASKGKQILVPLTSSLYVPGKLADVENVIVDVGTGYYVKKVCPSPCTSQLELTATNQTKKEAVTHYNSKTTFVQGNLETLQKTIERKQENAQMVVQVLQMKLQEGAQPSQ